MYHGNWCGPGWSDGKTQNSVHGFAPGVDEFDETCRQHDFAYADSGNLRDADLLFSRQNIGHGVKRTLAGIAVGAQGLLRSHDKYIPNVYQTKEKEEMVKTSQRLRGAAPSKGSKAPTNGAGVKKTPKGGPSTMHLSMAPVAIGTTIRGGKPKITRSIETARIAGNDFIGTVEGQGVSTFGLGKSALLSPAYFASTFLGNLARSYEKYRWNKLRIHYVPKVATTVTGQIILASQRSVSEPGLQPESGTFLQRAMSQGNAVFGPLWTEHYIDIDCTNEFQLIDPTTTSDIDDCVHEELQVYTQINSAQQCGYLFAEYDVSFMEPIYQPHSTSLPIATGPGVRVVLSDQVNINAVNDDWALVDNSGTLGLNNVPNGTIYRCVFDLQGSTSATGATFANQLIVSTNARATTTTFSLANTNIQMIGGFTAYGVVFGTLLTMYTSIEGAINGVGSGQLFHRTAVTVSGAYNFDMALVRQGVATIATVQ
jgi:hypothetical protein